MELERSSVVASFLGLPSGSYTLGTSRGGFEISGQYAIENGTSYTGCDVKYQFVANQNAIMTNKSITCRSLTPAELTTIPEAISTVSCNDIHISLESAGVVMSALDIGNRKYVSDRDPRVKTLRSRCLPKVDKDQK